MWQGRQILSKINQSGSRSILKLLRLMAITIKRIKKKVKWLLMLSKIWESEDSGKILLFN